MKGLFIFLTLLFWFFALKTIPKEFYDLGGDSAQYIILAEALSEGRGFRAINYPDEPFFSYYPPFFCLLLFPIIHFFGRNFYSMHFLIICLGYISLWFLYLLFKRYSDKKIAFLSIFFFGLNWTFILYCSNYILSEIPYLFLTSLTFLLFSQYLEDSAFLNKKGFGVLLGLILCYLTRYIGLSLFLALIFVLLLTDKKAKFKKISFLTCGFIFLFITWNVFRFLNATEVSPSHFRQIFLINPYSPYQGSLLTHPSYFILRFTEGVNYYYRLLADVFFFPLLNKPIFLKETFGILILGFLFLGFWRKFKEDKACPFHYYFLFYFLLIIFWPFREGMRFILPVLPFIFFYFLIGVNRFLFFLKQQSLVFYLILIFFSIFSLQSFFINHSKRNIPQEHKNFILLHNWIKENLVDEGIILSRKPTVTYLFTKHKSIGLPFTLNTKEIWEKIEKDDVKYIIVDEFSPETYRYLLPFLYRYSDKLKPLHHIQNTQLLEVRRN